MTSPAPPHLQQDGGLAPLTNFVEDAFHKDGSVFLILFLRVFFDESFFWTKNNSIIIFRLSEKNFREGCQNCILRVQKNVLGKSLFL